MEKLIGNWEFLYNRHKNKEIKIYNKYKEIYNLKRKIKIYIDLKVYIKERVIFH